MTLVADLRIFHSPSPSATRRVAPVPLQVYETGGVEASLFLVASVVGWFTPLLDDRDRDALEAVLVEFEQRPMPRRCLRHRLQEDTHGLDVSWHRLSATRNGWGLVLDEHGPAAPQVAGALGALRGLPESDRLHGIELARETIDWTGGDLADLGRFVRDRLDPRGVAEVEQGVRAWAMEILGLRLEAAAIELDDVQRAYRRRIREAHPDHGAPAEGAADRLDELRRAKMILTGTD